MNRRIAAYGAGKLACKYAKYKEHRFYKLLSDKILFRYISEWHPLLTPYLLPDTKVQADLLCINNTLYQGEVSQHFLKDGQLTGIILTDPRRFDRERYLADKNLAATANEPKPDKEKYWIRIPSRNLYFFAGKIFNIKLTYVTGTGAPIDATAVVNFVESTLGPKLKDVSLRPSSTAHLDPSASIFCQTIDFAFHACGALVGSVAGAANKIRLTTIATSPFMFDLLRFVF